VNIALVTETFPPEINGVAMTFGRLTRELAQRGHRLTVHRPRLPQTRPASPALPCREEFFPGMPIPGYPLLRLGFPARRRFRQLWRAHRPDLVHVVTEGPLGASAISAARDLGLPLTSSFHTNFHTYTSHYGFGPLHRAALGWLRRIHNRTRCTFAPTTELCEELRALGFNNVRVLSRGVDLHHFSPDRRSAELRASWGAGPDDPVVLHVGRIAAEKNYPLLFRAFAAMRAANPRVRCIVAGEGPLKARFQRDHPDVIFAGFYSREEIGRFYASADLYLHASLSETFGNVLTEAMASGLAVAGFNYAAAREFIRHRENGLAVPRDRPEALVAAAVQLATDASLRQRLRANARAALLDQTWERVAARFESDLVELAGHSNHSGEPRAVFAQNRRVAPADAAP
jgi:Glycosyltransferase